jgi:hypothetical protein
MLPGTRLIGRWRNDMRARLRRRTEKAGEIIIEIIWASKAPSPRGARRNERRVRSLLCAGAGTGGAAIFVFYRFSFADADGGGRGRRSGGGAGGVGPAPRAGGVGPAASDRRRGQAEGGWRTAAAIAKPRFRSALTRSRASRGRASRGRRGGRSRRPRCSTTRRP